MTIDQANVAKAPYAIHKKKKKQRITMQLFRGLFNLFFRRFPSTNDCAYAPTAACRTMLVPRSITIFYGCRSYATQYINTSCHTHLLFEMSEDFQKSVGMSTHCYQFSRVSIPPHSYKIVL